MRHYPARLSSHDVGPQRHACRQRMSHFKCCIPLGRAYRMGHLCGDRHPVAVLHQRMAEISKPAFLAESLAIKPRIHISEWRPASGSCVSLGESSVRPGENS